MTKHNKKKSHELNTGDSFIDLARKLGAVVTEAGNFFKVKTPKGSMKIAPGDEILDKPTISNTKKWFKLLGLLAVILLWHFRALF